MLSKIYYHISYFMPLLLGVILLGILLTYDTSGYSLNSIAMLDNMSGIESLRNIIADVLFQTLGIASYIIPLFFVFCAFQMYTKKHVPLLKYKIITFFYTLITLPPIIAIIYDKYSAGILGVFLEYEMPFFAQFIYIFALLALISLLFSFSVSLQDIITTKNSLISFIKFIYAKIINFKSKGQKVDYNYQEPKTKINILPDIESVKLSHKLKDYEIEEPEYLDDNKREDFKNSIFYQNIKATQLKEEDPIEDIDNDFDFSSKDLNKEFFSNFAENRPLNAYNNSTYNSSNITQKPEKDTFLETTEEVFEPKPIINNENSIQSFTTPPQMPQKTNSINNINIELSKEKEGISTIKEATKNYSIPLSFLNIKPQKNTTSTFEIKQNAINLEQIIQEFGINCKVVNIKTGPVVTLYEIAIPAGVKTSKIISLETDIALRMKATSVRIAVVAGKDVVGIEIPNSIRKTVFLKEILQSKSFKETQAKLPVALGYDINGNAIVADLATMPHLLIAGTTGSGKSVGVNGMILSLLYKLPPEQCKLIMIDPKMLELSVYQDIPHLLTPVVINPKLAISALKWVVKEMENRYYQMSLLAVRNITGFNQKLENVEEIEKLQDALYDKQGLDIKFKPMPYIVVIIDEMADLMMVAGKEVEMAVQRLAQMARASGIHLIMATQRPSVDVITGTIKANFPTRISFQVSSKIDSRTILGEQGAEQLLGKGDMLYMSGVGRVQRVHGAFVEDSEVSSIVDYLKDLSSPNYIDNITSVSITSYDNDNNSSEEKDELYSQVIEMIQVERKISTSFIQRKFQIGYNRAARIMEQLEEDGIISKANAMGKREILIK